MFAGTEWSDRYNQPQGYGPRTTGPGAGTFATYGDVINYTNQRLGNQQSPALSANAGLGGWQGIGAGRAPAQSYGPLDYQYKVDYPIEGDQARTQQARNQLAAAMGLYTNALGNVGNYQNQLSQLTQSLGPQTQALNSAYTGELGKQAMSNIGQSYTQGQAGAAAVGKSFTDQMNNYLTAANASMDTGNKNYQAAYTGAKGDVQGMVGRANTAADTDWARQYDAAQQAENRKNAMLASMYASKGAGGAFTNRSIAGSQEGTLATARANALANMAAAHQANLGQGLSYTNALNQANLGEQSAAINRAIASQQYGAGLGAQGASMAAQLQAANEARNANAMINLPQQVWSNQLAAYGRPQQIQSNLLQGQYNMPLSYTQAAQQAALQGNLGLSQLQGETSIVNRYNPYLAAMAMANQNRGGGGNTGGAPPYFPQSPGLPNGGEPVGGGMSGQGEIPNNPYGFSNSEWQQRISQFSPMSWSDPRNPWNQGVQSPGHGILPEQEGGYVPPSYPAMYTNPNYGMMSQTIPGYQYMWGLE